MSRRSRITAGVREAILQPEDIPGKVERSRQGIIDSYDTPPGTEYASIREYFRTSVGNEFLVEFRGSVGVGYAVEFRKLPTGRGFQKEKLGEVFANVVSVVRDFVKKYDPPMLAFAGATEKHTAIYAKLLERLFPGKWERKHGGFVVTLEEPQQRLAVLQDLSGASPTWTTGDLGAVSEFKTSDGVGYIVNFDDEGSGSWHVTFDTHPFGTRPSGKPFEVFQTVASTLVAFIRDHRPGEIAFSGATPGLENLYRRFLHRLLPSHQWVEEGDEFILKFTNE